MSPSSGTSSSPNAHKNRITASPEQTIMPTNRSIAAMKTKNTTKAFLKRRRGFLYNAIKMTAFGSDIENERNKKSIPLLWQSDFSKSRSIALEETFTRVSLEAHIFRPYGHWLYLTIC